MDYATFPKLNESTILNEFNLINSNQISNSLLTSLAWRNSLGLIASTPTSICQHLAFKRQEYDKLKATYLTSPETITGAHANIQVDNPLSNESGNVWTTWFKDVELRETIQQDVLRCFPEIDYFKSPSVQDKLTNLLFIYTKLNHADGYSQGLHEVLAPLLLVCDLDSLSPSSPPGASDSTTTPLPTSNESLARIVLSREYVEHDTFSLFQALMKSVRVFYDSNLSVSLPLERPGMTTARHTTSASNSTPKVLVQPIIAIAHRIQDNLKIYDFELYSALISLEIAPQIYVMRWLRMLFSREFSFNEIILLWTGLFAEDSELKLLEYVVVAMLLRIREAILTQHDYTNTLQLLLRYPLPISSLLDQYEKGNFRVEILLKQAIYLRDNTGAEAGERCREENIESGLESGEIEEGKRRRTPTRTTALPSPPAKAAPAAYSTSQIAAALLAEGVGGIARRAELMGVNKALIETFNDIRRGVNSIESEFPARAFTRDRDSVVELNRLRSENLVMSKALETCVDILQLRYTIAPSETKDDAADGKGLMALTVLKHIKEVLAGSTQFDRNVLSPLTSATRSESRLPTTSINAAPLGPQTTAAALILGQRSAPPPLSGLTRTPPASSPKSAPASELTSGPMSVPASPPASFAAPIPVTNRFAAASQRMDLTQRVDRRREDRANDPLGVNMR